MTRRTTVALLLAAVLAPLFSLLSPAGAATSAEELREQRRQVQRQRAAQASQIDVLQASEQELTAALDAIEDNRAAQAAAVESARQRSAAESARAVQARAKLDATVAQLAQLRAEVRRLAVDEYIRGGRPQLDVAPGGSSPMEAARRRSLLTAAVAQSSDVTDELKRAQEDLEVERAAAEAAAEAAASEERRVEQQLAALEADLRQQQAVAEQVESKLERALAEADNLAAVDASLAARYQQEQAALAARLRVVPRRVATGGGGGGGGQVTRQSGSRSLTTVRGITVASSIAGQLDAMLAAAEADGIVMRGGGYRDSQQQIATRRNNCGSSDYDIYEKPASQCSPPTARPGSSMHEQGLAVDFTHDGAILTRSSPAYRWLQANAGRYGFRNLPSEAWHWSTTGN